MGTCLKISVMKKISLALWAPFLLSVICTFTGLAQSGVSRPAADPPSNTDYIDPTIGNVGQLLEPTRPTVQLPNQMIRMTPQRQDYMDDQISSFPLTIVSHRLGQVFAIKPTLKETVPAAWDAKMTYDRTLEVNKPWYYSTYLIDDDITVEYAAGRKTGYYRFLFPAGAAHKSVLLGVYNDGASEWHFTSASEVTGMETYHGDIKVYMYGVFSRGGTGKVEGRRAYISVPGDTRELEFKYAISYISQEQAKKNYEEEIAKERFEHFMTLGKAKWSQVISQIKVEGGTVAQRRSFYTSLYRCYERMVDITEDGKYYSGFDKQVHSDPRPFYVDDWSWDTYLALHPLRTLLQPSMEEDMLQSYVRMYMQGGWMPTFPVLFGDHACMNGFHSSITFLDAYRKGLRRFDVGKAYEGMRKNSVSATLLPWENGEKTVLDSFYDVHGYFPALHPGEKETVQRVHPFEKRQAVAVTLGASYDDWALGQLGGDLGMGDDKARFAQRGENYKHLWNEQEHFFLPRDDKGEWIRIDPKYDGGPGGRDYYDENNGWTYLWQVQQDIPGLIGLMGGRQSFEDRLDQLFREGLDMGRNVFWYKFPDATGLTGQHSMGNEPGFVIPYLYNFTGSPWKTQSRVRFLLDTWFKDNIFGIPGDEDGGGMSAFVVFSSMGFYPMVPGTPSYTVGSPVFSKVTISLANGRKFRIIAHHASVVNKYIQSAIFDGKRLDTPWFTHQQLVNGGCLELVMGPKPDKKWGHE
jgi:predicted alpha-1,2-mannosidase